MAVPPSISTFEQKPALRGVITLVAIFLMSLVLLFVLSTREGASPVNDGVIELPVEDFSSRFLGLYGEALLDIEPTVPISQISQSDDWQKLNTRYISFDAISKPVWLRVKLRNFKDEPITVRFDTRRVAFKSMQFFLTPDGGETVTQFLDYTYEAPFANRPVDHRILVADAELQPNEETTFYVHYEGLYNSVLPLRISHPAAFERADKHEIFWASIFYGVAGATFFLTILTWWLTGWRLSVSFGLFLIASLLSVWSVEGYVDQLVIPTKNAITAHLTDAIYLWTYGAILLLSRNLFDLKSKAPVLDLLLRVAIIAIFTFSFVHLSIGVDSRNIFVPIALTCRVSSLALHASVGIWAIFNREKGGSIFTVSAVLLTMASAYMVLDETFGFPYGGIPFTLRWLVTIEILAFATAIVQNVASVRRERDAALVADLRATREKLRLNEALRDSQSAYERARLRAFDYRNRLQSVSHDILQPLSSLKTALYENLPENSDARKPLSEAFEYLQSLAYENLPAAKRAERAQDDDGETPITLVLDAVVAMFVSDAAAKGIDLNRHFEIDDTVSADPVLLMRAVSNLVANAINYTSNGAVTVSAEQSNGMVTIEVNDSGPGLTRQQIDRVMQRGVSGDQSNGSGLGLSIVQDALDELNGSFELISTPGEGTTARCQIPVRVAEEIG
ncbi:MAG: sensor histidine kinase [Hyphomonadaceae bacterium]|nr:sensor histidine kinase [Hyphomonadaceae bacterium]